MPSDLPYGYFWHHERTAKPSERSNHRKIRLLAEPARLGKYSCENGVLEM